MTDLMQDKLQKIQKLAIFNNVSNHTLHELAAYAKLQHYKKKDIVLNDKDVQNIFLYIVKGWVKLFKDSANGDEIIVDILGDEHHCGEQFIFPIHNQELYQVEAISLVEVLAIPMAVLRRQITEEHQLALNFLKSAIEKQYELTLELEHLSIQTALQRMGCFILRLCEKNSENTAALRLPYDKSLLATRLGMRAETFSRSLAKLSKACDIDVDGEVLYIHNIKKLSDYVCQQCSQIFPCHS